MVPDWRPRCDMTQLRMRANLLRSIREFFQQHNVLEVETPLLCNATGCEPQLDFFSTEFRFFSEQRILFLQTSPEFAMKRLLAAGSGSIYQICKAFRNAEKGRFHNPEFTLLEWYRIDYGMSDLMCEVAELLRTLLAPCIDLQPTQVISYQDVFIEHTGLDPLDFQLAEFQQYVLRQGFPEALSLCGDDTDLWLDFVFSHRIQPELGRSSVDLVHSYPSAQPALARISKTNPLVADRFEVFVEGVELGNGFFELADPVEQNRRFDYDNARRSAADKPVIKKDVRLLAALESGLPTCSGVAIGLDRLLMIMTGSASINEVLAFPIASA